MTNTYLLEGDADADENRRQTAPRVYVASSEAVRSTPPPATSSSAMTAAFMIENGQITRAARLQLIGKRSRGPGSGTTPWRATLNDPRHLRQDGQSVPVGIGSGDDAPQRGSH